MNYPDMEKLQNELDRIRGIASSEFSGLAWMEHHENRIRWLSASGNLNLRYKQLALKPGRGLAGLVIRLGRPLIINSTIQDYEQIKHDYPIMSVESLHSAIAIPIIIRDNTQGVLLVGNRTERIYHNDDLPVLIAAADGLALLFLQSKMNKN